MADDFVTPYANSVFEQPWWLDTVAEGKWHEAIVKEGDRVIARLPYVLDHGVIRNPVYTQTLGIWMAEELRAFDKGNSQLHRQKEVIDALLSKLPKAKSICITLDHSNAYVIPYRWHGFRMEPSFSYRIKDLSDMEGVRARFGKTVKKNIKAAQRNLTVEEDTDDLQTLLELQALTYARQNRKPPVDDDLTLRVMENAVKHHSGKLLISRDRDGKAHGAAFFIYDENACYYILSGQDPQFRSDGSQNLLLEKGIEFASTVSRAFDFEGSMVEGIENFFRQFGGELVVNYRISRQSVLRDVADILKPRVKSIIGYKI